MNDVWKDIPGYEGYYQVSDQGNIRSLDRNIPHPRSKSGYHKIKGGTISINSDCMGYKYVILRKHSGDFTHKIHRLVMLAFVGSSDLDVDHINNKKHDNRLCNLQYLTSRQNSVKHTLTIPGKKSNLTGVWYSEKEKAWRTAFHVNGRSIYIGSYKTDEEAADAYKKAVEVHNENPNKVYPKRIKFSLYVGVSYNKSRRKWQAYIYIDGKMKYLGIFDTEEQAYEKVKKSA